MKYNKFLTLIVPVLSFIFLEIYSFYPKSVFVILVIIFSLFFFLARQFAYASGKKDNIINTISLPILFTFGSVFVSFFIINKWVVHVLFLVNLIFLYYYFKMLYYHFLKLDLFQKEKMENLSTYGNFLAFYFMAVSFFGLQLFLDIAIWKLIILLAGVVFLIVFQISWSGEINKQTSFFYSLLLSLIVLELAWGISFLTLSYYILGLILTISFYVLIGLIRFYLFGNLSKEKVKMYLIFGLISVSIALLTARWI
ncbi:hypothetical protein L6270_03760 [Candidatus Parcubacteria bacterium]|nr:hypothetical protein [Patescibacteria group bacterium]MBU4309079.1 hypothetical protein [Patescibacteria group bacterium]MBU4432457.1 hypothetical protein [Patescibacteria group bacterium]MBU4577440.1 hypothetical protein [Patescibacteria group bacterium]MCG2697128.1 hypothetical protein [Candidatus Parcubacteria bacterium]